MFQAYVYAQDQQTAVARFRSEGSRTMAHIVYEDDDIRAIWHPGASDFLLVTFGDMVTCTQDMRFFADGPVMKSNLSCLGLVAKRPNWYPPESMRHLLERIADDIAPYQTRITYGGSMGGYAAIKYSRLIGATHVMSLCPQWSINPADCSKQYLPWGDYYVPDMREMAIRRADISGRVVVFSDSRFEVDAYHRDQIAREWPDLIAINVNSSDHHVTSVFAGSQNLHDLIFAVRYLQPDNILSVANALRRRSLFRDEIVMRRATPRYPRLVARILLARAGKDANYRSLRLNFYTDVVRALLRSGHRALAFLVLATFSGQFARRGPYHVFRACVERVSGKVGTRVGGLRTAPG